MYFYFDLLAVIDDGMRTRVIEASRDILRCAQVPCRPILLAAADYVTHRLLHRALQLAWRHPLCNKNHARVSSFLRQKDLSFWTHVAMQPSRSKWMPWAPQNCFPKWGRAPAPSGTGIWTRPLWTSSGNPTARPRHCEWNLCEKCFIFKQKLESRAEIVGISVRIQAQAGKTVVQVGSARLQLFSGSVFIISSFCAVLISYPQVSQTDCSSIVFALCFLLLWQADILWLILGTGDWGNNNTTCYNF